MVKILFAGEFEITRFTLRKSLYSKLGERNQQMMEQIPCGVEISLAIRAERDDLPNSRSEYCIYRVNSHLRMVNEKAYDPEIIAIGPYHRGKESLKMMEEHKLRYLHSLLKRRKENVEAYINVVRSLEDRARKCYAELPELTSDEFIEMLVLDGCFIVELFRKVSKRSMRDDSDPIFIMDWMKKSLQRDLMLFENQIPFFVLFKLFERTGVPCQGEDENFIKLAISFFWDLFPGDGQAEDADDKWHEETKHLLGLIHNNWLPLFAGVEVGEGRTKKQKNWEAIRCASKLTEFGVSFVKDQERGLMEIKFTNGTLHIPQLVIKDSTECFLRNLIAYELYHQHIRHSHVINYTKFFDRLIDSQKDVEILCRHEIIDNWLGDDKDVSEMFNKINQSVTDPSSYHYIDILNKVDAHCNRRVNRWMANLREKYLSSPWAVISVLAGSVLLLLTFTQTVFSVLSYKGK